jgi:hypothetical protein
MSPNSASTLPALGAIAVLSLGLTACGTLSNTTASRAQVTLNVADAAMASGAPDLALRVADMVLAKQPDSAAALTARGDALYAMNQVELAGQAYRAAVRSASAAPRSAPIPRQRRRRSSPRLRCSRTIPSHSAISALRGICRSTTRQRRKRIARRSR